MAPIYGMPWNLTEIHGWGLVGIHTALHLIDQGRPPFVLAEPFLSTVRPHLRSRLEGLVEPWRRFAELEKQCLANQQVIKFSDIDVMRPLGNMLTTQAAHVEGRRNIGVIAFEDTRVDAEAKARGDRLDFIVTHSLYNQRLLQDAGFGDVRMAWQGVDPEEMVLPPRSDRFAGRFVVFSGGKLEFRKAQDVVLRAFAIFQKTHPDALLVTAWHSLWPQISLNIAESPLCAAVPKIVDGKLRIAEWAAAFGVPSDAFVDLGFVLRPDLPQLMADVDAAVFPNRCEGATNLVAMEAMGSGVPCVIARNTGQADLMTTPDTCFPLDRQRPLDNPRGDRTGWCESDVDEIVAALEAIYTDRAEARRRAQIGRDFILGERTWGRFAETFVAECDR